MPIPTFKIGDKVEYEERPNSSRPRWDYEIDHGCSGIWRTGVITGIEIDTIIICDNKDKYIWCWPTPRDKYLWYYTRPGYLCLSSLTLTSNRKKKPPIAIKRRAYIEILESGHIKITNSYNTKEFYFKSSFQTESINLVTLKQEAKNKYTSPFYCYCKFYDDGEFVVKVCNEQANPTFIGQLSMKYGPVKNDFRCTIIEDSI